MARRRAGALPALDLPLPAAVDQGVGKSPDAMQAAL